MTDTLSNSKARKMTRLMKVAKIQEITEIARALVSQKEKQVAFYKLILGILLDNSIQRQKSMIKLKETDLS